MDQVVVRRTNLLSLPIQWMKWDHFVHWNQTVHSKVRECSMVSQIVSRCSLRLEFSSNDPAIILVVHESNVWNQTHTGKVAHPKEMCLPHSQLWNYGCLKFMILSYSFRSSHTYFWYDISTFWMQILLAATKLSFKILYFLWNWNWTYCTNPKWASWKHPTGLTVG